MADYSQQMADLQAAADICQQHVIKTPVNGVQSEYPRWPEAWAACEKVWRNYLDMKTLEAIDEDDRRVIIDESNRLR